MHRSLLSRQMAERRGWRQAALGPIVTPQEGTIKRRMGRVELETFWQDILFIKKHTEPGMLVNTFNLSSGNVGELKENLAYFPSSNSARDIP